MSRNHHQDAYRVFLAQEAAAALFRSMVYFAFAIYLVRTLGLNPFQLVLVGTTLEITCFLFQVPTGVVADTYSRRLSVIIGFGLIGIGFVLMGAIPAFAAVLAAQVVWGIGETFVDGALQAWIADEVGEDQLDRVFLRGGQVGQIGGLIGLGAGVGLALLDLRVPIVLGGIAVVLLAGWLAVAMPERGWTRPTRGEQTGIGWRAEHWTSMRATVREGSGLVRGQPVLMALMVVGAVAGASSEAFDRLWEAHFLTSFAFPGIGNLDPVIWFGIIHFAGTPIGLLGSEVLVRRMPTGGQRSSARALFAITAVLVLGTVAFALAGSFALALAAFYLIGLARTLRYPVYTAWLNRQIDSKTRATVLSMSSQADAFGQIAGGPIIGGVGALYGIRAAIAVSGVALVPALGLFARLGRGDVEVIEDGQAAAARARG